STRPRSGPMPAPATLTGQDVGEAEGALSALLNQVLSNTDITRNQYITLRVLALRGPAPSPAELHDYLASQPQLGLDRSQIAGLLLDLEAKGLVAGSAADGARAHQAHRRGRRPPRQAGRGRRRRHQTRVWRPRPRRPCYHPPGAGRGHRTR